MADYFVKKFQMEPHPEGGFFKRFFESKDKIQTLYGERFAMTSVHYLMTFESFNAFHLLKQNTEVIYFQDVNTLILQPLYYHVIIYFIVISLGLAGKILFDSPRRVT